MSRQQTSHENGAPPQVASVQFNLVLVVLCMLRDCRALVVGGGFCGILGFSVCKVAGALQGRRQAWVVEVGP